MLSEDDIARVAARIAGRFAPIAVATFGSYAIGTAHDRSDLDVVVIRNPAIPSTFDRRAVRWLLASVLHPLDIHVFAPAEFETAAGETHSFAAHIAQQARLYYWTKDARQHVPSLFVGRTYADLVPAS